MAVGGWLGGPAAARPGGPLAARALAGRPGSARRPPLVNASAGRQEGAVVAEVAAGAGAPRAGAPAGERPAEAQPLRGSRSPRAAPRAASGHLLPPS